MKILAVLAICASAAVAQQLDLSALDKFADRAQDGANVSLDAPKLKFASQFLSSGKTGEEQAKKVLSSIQGIYVRTFEFDKAGEYTQADLEPVRKQLRQPGWSKVIEVKEKNETVEVHFFTGPDGKYGGLAVVSAEPKEVAVVNIVGAIDLNSLAQLSGTLGIPEIGASLTSPKPQQPKKKDDEDE